MCHSFKVNILVATKWAKKIKYNEKKIHEDKNKLYVMYSCNGILVATKWAKKNKHCKKIMKTKTICTS